MKVPKSQNLFLPTNKPIQTIPYMVLRNGSPNTKSCAQRDLCSASFQVMLYILGLVSKHSIRERRLCDALQVRANELPVKIVKSTLKNRKGQNSEVEDPGEVGSYGNVSLYGKWQTEPFRLQPAANGIVPKGRFFFKSV